MSGTMERTLLVAVCAAILVAVTGIVTEHRKCGGADIEGLVIEPCENEKICEVKRGSSLNVSAVFIANQDTEKIKVSISALVEGISLVFPGISRNGCKSNNLSCPVKTGDKLHWMTQLPIRSFFPKLSNIEAKFLLEGDKGVLSCFTGRVSLT